MLTTERAATIRLNKSIVRGVIADLEATLGVEAAYPATQHALALFQALADMEPGAASAAQSAEGRSRGTLARPEQGEGAR